MKLLFFLFLLLICYQDAPTLNSIGEIARSPIFFFLPVLIGWNLFSPGLKKSIYIDFSKLLLALIIIFVLVTAINGVYWFFILGNRASYLGENMVVKCLKEVVYFVQFYFLYLSSVKFFEYFLKIGVSHLVQILTWFILFLLGILIIELITLPNAFAFLHNENPYPRIRLLTGESSWTGHIIVTISTIYLSLAKSKIQQALGIGFLIINIALTGSKMMMVCLPVTFFVIYLQKWNIKRVLFSLVAGVTAYFILFPIIISSFLIDLEEYSSVISRSTSFLSALMTGFNSVIGVGGFYPYYFINNINPAVDTILGIIGFGNTYEVFGWGSDGFKSISGGSTFAHLIMQIGIFGLIFFVILCRKLLLLCKGNNYLLFGAIYFIISNSLSEIFIMRLMWPVFFAFLSFYKTNEHELKGADSNS